MRLLRIVPDDTKFDFMRFRRISFPISALMSIIAISLYFFHGLNFGIDFKGGTLIEVQSKAAEALSLIHISEPTRLGMISCSRSASWR